MLALEGLSLLGLALFHNELFFVLLSMLAANHLGGRLAFIAMGLELNLVAGPIILIILFHNSMYLLIMYSLFVKLSSGLARVKFIQGYLETLRRGAVLQAGRRGRWSRLALFVFVWIPFPWTGAAIGSYIAHLVGYSVNQTLKIVGPAMWLGVIIWTLWFDELYAYVERLGLENTLFITIPLIGIPLLYSLIDMLVKRRRISRNDGPDQAI